MAEHRAAMKQMQEKAKKKREEKREREAAVQSAADEEANRAQRFLEDARKKREEWVGVVMAVHANDEVIALAKMTQMKDAKTALSASVGLGGATLLHLAVSRGFRELIETVLKLDPEAVRFRDEDGQTPLHRAAAVDSDGELIELLAEHLVVEDLDREDDRERSPQDIAEQWGFSATFETLRSLRQRLTLPPEPILDEVVVDEVVAKFPGFGATAGFTGMQEDRFDDVLQLIQEPMWVFVNNMNKIKRTLLHFAASKGREDICEALLARSDFNTADAADSDRATALHLAVAGERAGCCRAIIDSDKFRAVNAVDLRRRTALHLAAMKGNEEVYEIVAAHPECSALLPDFEGRTAADIALKQGMDVKLPGSEGLSTDLEL